MCWRDVVTALRQLGIDATESQIRWAIKTEKVSRPPLDGSLRFAFSEQHVAEIRTYFHNQLAASDGANSLGI